MSHKTHHNSDQISRIIINPIIFTPKNSKSAPPAGVGFVAVRAPSVEEHLSHALTQLRTHVARTHARTTRTRNETETDFPIGFS